MKTRAESGLIIMLTVITAGCKQKPEPNLPLTPVAYDSVTELDLLQEGPTFNVLDFSMAEFDPETQRVYLARTLFDMQQRTREEEYTVMRPVQTTREITDANGKSTTVFEQGEVAEHRTRQYHYTEFNLVDEQVFSCPIDTVAVFDNRGKQLSVQQIQSTFQQTSRVILQDPGVKYSAYYSAFLHPDVHFIQSKDWVAEDVDEIVGESKAAPPSPVIDPSLN